MPSKVEFDPGSHTYCLSGKRVPSVTQVLELAEDFSAVPPQLLEAARDFGQHVHAAVDLLLRNDLNWSALDPALEPYLLGAQRFLDESGVTPLYSEEPVAHTVLRYAGTPDLVGLFRNAVSVFDFKSGAVPSTVGAQTAAYGEACRLYHGIAAPKRYCVQLLPNDYRVHALRDRSDWSLFVSCLNVWRFKYAAAAA